MPILYVHGVNTRSHEGFEQFKPFARRYLAPEISSTPETVTIDECYWGDIAFSPAFGGISRPRSRLLGMGADDKVGPQATSALFAASTGAGGLPVTLPQTTPTAPTGGLAGGGPVDTAPTVAAPELTTAALLALSDDTLSDALAGLIAAQPWPADGTPTDTPEARAARLAIIADDMVRDGTARRLIKQSATIEAAIAALVSGIAQREAATSALAGMGIGDVFKKLKDGFTETSSALANWKGYLVSVVLAEARGPVNDLASRFLGDVFVYLRERGNATAPGPIPRRLLDKLLELHTLAETQKERLVVVSHSMGGQLIYDAVTHFMPRSPAWARIRIDHWCATASQVGFFEEGKLFLESLAVSGPGHLVKLPLGDNLGGWWNVWDYNDVLSFTCSGIFKDVDDSSFDSHHTLLDAHGAYLATPSFYRAYAKKLAELER